jgi:hypothetical protein
MSSLSLARRSMRNSRAASLRSRACSSSSHRWAVAAARSPMHGFSVPCLDARSCRRRIEVAVAGGAGLGPGRHTLRLANQRRVSYAGRGGGQAIATRKSIMISEQPRCAIRSMMLACGIGEGNPRAASSAEMVRDCSAKPMSSVAFLSCASVSSPVRRGS